MMHHKSFGLGLTSVNEVHVHMVSIIDGIIIFFYLWFYDILCVMLRLLFLVYFLVFFIFSVIIREFLQYFILGLPYLGLFNFLG